MTERSDRARCLPGPCTASVTADPASHTIASGFPILAADELSDQQFAGGGAGGGRAEPSELLRRLGDAGRASLGGSAGGPWPPTWATWSPR